MSSTTIINISLDVESYTSLLCFRQLLQILISRTVPNYNSTQIFPISTHLVWVFSSMNGYMIKFEMFTNKNNSKYYSDTRVTFIVSISHYTHAYFNYQNLLQDANFRLLSDARYLNVSLLYTLFVLCYNTNTHIYFQSHPSTHQPFQINK